MKIGPREEQTRKLREARYGRRPTKAALAVKKEGPTRSAPVRDAGLDAPIPEGRGRGRPRVIADGERLHIVLSRALVGRLDAEGGRRGLSRSELVRVLLEEALR